jgi:mannose-6-phosphate isomerase-like protein (cupin superfamily)
MKKSLTHIVSNLTYFPNRTPKMSFTGGADEAFAEVAQFGTGAIYVGHYSGSSEWERHVNGDELVLVLAGSTTIVLMRDATQEMVELKELELVIVPAGVWHRFQDSLQLKVPTITPPSTEHRLEQPTDNPSQVNVPTKSRN